MGLFSGLVRLGYLKQRAITLEYKIQTLSSTKMRIASKAVDLVTIGNDLDPKSPEFKTLEARREKLNLMEKRLDQELLRYQTLLKSVNTEMQSAQQIVDASIKRFFVYGQGR